jgi:hypothetical protein
MGLPLACSIRLWRSTLHLSQYPDQLLALHHSLALSGELLLPEGFIDLPGPHQREEAPALPGIFHEGREEHNGGGKRGLELIGTKETGEGGGSSGIHGRSALASEEALDFNEVVHRKDDEALQQKAERARRREEPKHKKGKRGMDHYYWMRWKTRMPKR